MLKNVSTLNTAESAENAEVLAFIFLIPRFIGILNTNPSLIQSQNLIMINFGIDTLDIYVKLRTCSCKLHDFLITYSKYKKVEAILFIEINHYLYNCFQIGVLIYLPFSGTLCIHLQTVPLTFFPNAVTPDKGK